MILSLEQRFDWLKSHEPKGFDPELGDWETFVESNIERDMYSYMFNNPIYGADGSMTDDEARHKLLDDLDVPRTI